jgi:hypothetical protein
MAFTFTDKNGKPLKNTQIEWRLENGSTFKSEPERFERNVAYWKSKLGLAKDSKVEILNGNIEIEVPQTTKIENYANTLTEPVAAEPAIESSISQPDEQPDLFEDLEGDVNTPKPKSRKKTS